MSNHTEFLEKLYKLRDVSMGRLSQGHPSDSDLKRLESIFRVIDGVEALAPKKPAKPSKKEAD